MRISLISATQGTNHLGPVISTNVHDDDDWAAD